MCSSPSGSAFLSTIIPVTVLHLSSTWSRLGVQTKFQRFLSQSPPAFCAAEWINEKSKAGDMSSMRKREFFFILVFGGSYNKTKATLNMLYSFFCATSNFSVINYDSSFLFFHLNYMGNYKRTDLTCCCAVLIKPSALRRYAVVGVRN